MLIKIAKAPYFEGSNNNSFMLIQAQEVLSFKTQPYWEFDSINELDRMYTAWHMLDLPTVSTIDIDKIEDLIRTEHDDEVLTSQLHKHRVYRANYIIIKNMEGKEIQYIFDTIAYICNDKGETLEKCFAGGVLND